MVTFDGKRAPLARIEIADSAGPHREFPRVGRYGVDVRSFQRVALPALELPRDSKTPSEGENTEHSDPSLSNSGPSHSNSDRPPSSSDHSTSAARKILMVVDEVGKMELFSHGFVERVWQLFVDDHTPSTGVGVVLLVTIPVSRPHQKPHWLLRRIRQRQDCKLYEVSELNRESLVEEIVTLLLQIL